MAPLYPEWGGGPAGPTKRLSLTELELTGVILMTTTEAERLTCEGGSEIWSYGNAKYQHANGTGFIPAEYGRWFEGMAKWQWFVTRTYSPDFLTKGFTQAGETTCRRMLLDLLKRSAAESFVAVFERQTRGDFHLHALLAGCRGLDGTKEESRDKAKFGFAKWKIFRGTGAGAYLAKYLAKDMMSLYVGLDGPYETMRKLYQARA